MLRHRSTVAMVAVVASLSLLFASSSTAQENAKPKWISDAESALVGTWKNTADQAEAMPDLDIRLNRDKLKIRMIDPEAEDESYDQLFVLTNSAGEDSANAFASIDVEGVETHMVLSLQAEDLKVDAVQIFKDSSGRPNRMVSATYTASEGNGTATNSRRASSSRTKSRSTAKKSSSKKAPKLGRIAGEISTRSTLRGTISLTPAPKKIRPADGLIKISGTNPQFDFSNLPVGKYDLHFEGTINGASRAVDWKGVKTDPAGTGPTLSLSLRSGDN